MNREQFDKESEELSLVKPPISGKQVAMVQDLKYQRQMKRKGI